MNSNNATDSPILDLLKLDNQLCFSIYAASRAITKIYRPLLEKYDLTYPQYLVLLTLWEKDGELVNEIGNKLYLDSGTLTPLLKRMEVTGYITRKRGLEDERKVEIWLTKKARNLQEDAKEIPLGILKGTHLSLEQAAKTKALVDEIIKKVMICSEE